MTASGSISTSGSIHVVAGSTTVTPASRCPAMIWSRSWAPAVARSALVFTPSPTRGSSARYTATAPSVIHEMADGVGQVELPLGIVGIELREALPERVRVEDVDRRVHLPDRELLGARVARLDDRAGADPMHRGRCGRTSRARPARTKARSPQRPPVGARRAADRARRPRAAGRPLPARRRRPRTFASAGRADATASPVPRGVSWTASSTAVRQRAFELRQGLGGGDDHERARPELAGCRDRPVDQPPPQQLVQVLRPARAHARAQSRGHHHRCEGSVCHEGVMAGAGGFEPPITGPKPVALPLGYAPPQVEYRPARRGTHRRSIEEHDEQDDRHQRRG